MSYILKPFRHIFDIKGKASLKEFWYFFLFTWFVIYPVWILIRGHFDLSRAFEFWARVALCIPLTTLGFRRLNDAGYSKWLFLVPIAGVLLATAPKDSNSERQKPF